MERKKEKGKMKIRKRKKEKKGRIPNQRSKGSEKGKEATLDQRKKEDRKSPKARLPLRIILDWQYPTPHEQRGKDRNTQLPLQKR